MKLGTKIITGFIIVISLVSLVSTIAIFRMNEIKVASIRMDLEYIAEADIAFKIRADITNSRYQMLLYAYSGNIEYATESKRLLVKAYEGIHQGLALSEKYPNLVVLKQEMDELNAQIKEYENLALQIENINIDNNQALLDRFTTVGLHLTQIADKTANTGMTRIKEESANSITSINTSVTIIIIGLLVSLLISVFIALYISKKIVSPVKEMQAIMEKAEQGDLTVIAKITTKDEIGQLAESFNKMLRAQRESILSTVQTASTVQSSNQQQSRSMHELTITMDEMARSVTEVANNISDIATHMDNVSNSVGDLSKTIEDVAESATETSQTASDVTQSIVRIVESIEAIAEHSNTAKEEGNRTVEVTHQGKIVVDETIHEMNKIDTAMKSLLEAIQGLGKSSSQIGDIIKVIENIAEQTNLLALNASIEAARAGEHGKGFAVVASAISTLAEKSQDATKDITNLIKNIQENVIVAVDTTKDGVKQVENGVKMVNSTGQALDNIYTAVQSTVDLITEIASSTESQTQMSASISNGANKVNELSNQVSTAVEEQLATIEEIVKAVSNVSGLAQSVAGTSQQQSASSEEVFSTTQNAAELSKEMENGATILLKLLSKFKV